MADNKKDTVNMVIGMMITSASSAFFMGAVSYFLWSFITLDWNSFMAMRIGTSVGLVSPLIILFCFWFGDKFL